MATDQASNLHKSEQLVGKSSVSNDQAQMTLVGGRLLLPDGSLEEAVLSVSDGRIVEIRSDEGCGSEPRLNLTGQLVLPGVVDLHGDAFEHFLMPRSGVRFPVEMALTEVDRQMTANGITTAYHGITYSWEPGLRGRETVVEVMQALSRLADRLACDTRVHLRYELHNLEAEEEVAGWLAEGQIGLLALNEHLEMIVDRLERIDKIAQYSERSGLSIEDYKARVQAVARRGAEVPESVARLCRAAVTAGVPIASHDDETPDMREHYRDLGAGLCEFPCNLETARAAAAAGDAVVLGGPNVVRGGSHDARMTAEEAVREGICSVLASDYYYPSALAAPFVLAERGACDFAEAWNLVSGGPAAAVGLADRGRIVTGARGDLVVVDLAEGRRLPRVAATLAGGRLVHLADGRMMAA